MINLYFLYHSDLEENEINDIIPESYNDLENLKSL